MLNISTEHLILAMAPINDVMASFRRQSCDSVESPDPLDEQDRFAELICSCWTELGPSNRYIKALIRSYVSSLETTGITMESDKLTDLVFASA